MQGFRVGRSPALAALAGRLIIHVQRGSPPGCADATMDILGFLRVSSWKDTLRSGGATGTAA